MKKKEKRFILILLVLLIIVVAFKVKGNNKNSNDNVSVEQNGKISEQTEKNENAENEEFVEVLNDGTKLNTSDALSTAKKLGTLEFTNIQLTNQNNQSILLADVKNTGSETVPMQLVDVIILDKDGNELGKAGGIISEIEPGETAQFNTSTMIDYSNAYDFKIVEKAE